MGKQSEAGQKRVPRDRRWSVSRDPECVSLNATLPRRCQLPS